MHEVLIAPSDLAALETVAPAERIERLLRGDARPGRALDGTAVVNVNSTASGGGVAEMLQVLLPYARGAGIDARWFVIEGDAQFFAITKRIHNHLYGGEGDGGPLGEDEHRHYEAVLRDNAAQLANAVRPADIVVLHDPQPAGLAAAMNRRGARVVWRCHVGSEIENDHTAAGWAFLRRYLDPAVVEAYVFSRRGFAPSWIPGALVHAIPPSIDPFSPKNQELPDDDVRAILGAVGLIMADGREAGYRRRDGTRRGIEHGADVLRTGPPPAPDIPLVVQISRWDRLKDMAGVLHGFADYVVGDGEAQLVLAGPVVTSVADDPEGALVLQECREAWRRLPHHARRRVALACLPMADADENAIIVNALQRHAAVVTQKSLAEGFGLTVSEAMYKRRPVIASAVGGIMDQIVDGESGVLLPDPTDLDRFAVTLAALLADPDRARALGERAHDRVVERFLPDIQLGRWGDLLASLDGGRSRTGR
jgi:trehalose synthase